MSGTLSAVTPSTLTKSTPQDAYLLTIELKYGCAHGLV